MFKAESQKTAHKITIRILKSRAKDFAVFRKELDALLKKHGLKKRTK